MGRGPAPRGNRRRELGSRRRRGTGGPGDARRPGGGGSGAWRRKPAVSPTYVNPAFAYTVPRKGAGSTTVSHANTGWPCTACPPAQDPPEHVGPQVRGLNARENRASRIVPHIAEPVGAVIRRPARRGVPHPDLQRRTGNPPRGPPARRPRPRSSRALRRPAGTGLNNDDGPAAGPTRVHRRGPRPDGWRRGAPPRTPCAGGSARREWVSWSWLTAAAAKTSAPRRYWTRPPHSASLWVSPGPALRQ